MTLFKNGPADGTDSVNKISTSQGSFSVFFLSGYGATNGAIRACHNGMYDFENEPQAEIKRFVATVKSLLKQPPEQHVQFQRREDTQAEEKIRRQGEGENGRQGERESGYRQGDLFALEVLKGQSVAMQEVRQLIKKK